MSYDLYLRDPVTREKLEVPAHMMYGCNIKCEEINGVLVPTSTTEAYLNITYNYSSFYEKFLGGKGINDLDGKSVRETIPKMMEAACKMQGKTDADYWAKTEGNARKALLDLITLGLKALDGYWHVC